MNKGWKKRFLSILLAVFMLLACLPLNGWQAQAAAVNDYTQWKQYDAAWNQREAWPASQYPAATIRTMRGAGCLVTSIAMLLRHYNVVTTGDVNKFNPWICNEALKSVGAFNSAADLYYGKVSSAYPGFVYQGSTGYSLATLTSLYNQGYACIVQVNGSGGYSHFVAVKEISGSNVVIMDPGSENTNLNAYGKKYTIYYYKTSGSPTPPNHDPIGWLDAAEGYEGSFHVRGWAKDEDTPDTPIKVHVYIGGVVGSASAIGYEINADKYRGDVGAHGFDAVISTPLRGNQPVYVYAIDSSGGYNPLLSSCPKTVNILSDATPPAISNVKISDVSSSGYMITCTVSDNTGVTKAVFPTWTRGNGQDDLVADWLTSSKTQGKIDGNTVSYYVNTSDHNYESDVYYTHIYAYDAAGNGATAAVQAAIGRDVYLQDGGTKETTHNKNIYRRYSSTIATWSEAKTYCESIGGHLVTITSQEEEQIVEELISSGSQDAYWIGGTDEITEGTWNWVTGEDFSYTKWCDGEPNDNGNGQDYLRIMRDANVWDDVNSSSDADAAGFGFICEFENAASASGDVNKDGKVNTKDAALLMQYYAGWQVTIDKNAADVTGDGVINTKDVALILQKCAGWDVSFSSRSSS